jgi:hypothetical protein
LSMNTTNSNNAILLLLTNVIYKLKPTRAIDPNTKSGNPKQTELNAMIKSSGL